MLFGVNVVESTLCAGQRSKAVIDQTMSTDEEETAEQREVALAEDEELTTFNAAA